MPSASRFPVLAFFGLLGLSGCGGPPDALTPSFAAGTCILSFSYIGGKTLTVQANSRDNDAGWFIKNTGTGSATITAQTVSKAGNVTAVRPINWAAFPFTLAAGEQIDADLYFDAGAPGTGSVSMSISSSCGAKTLPIHSVVIPVSGTCTIVTDLQNKPIRALAKPGYLQSVTDSAFGTQITRITGDPATSIPGFPGYTWGDTARHRYSKEAAWNADQSLIVLKRVYTDPTSHLFLNGSTYQVEFTGAPPSAARETETRWHPTMPDVMIYVTKRPPLVVGHWNVRTNGVTQLVNVSTDSNGYFGPSEGNPSRDGRYIVVFATHRSDKKNVAYAVDLSTGQKFADIDIGASGLEVTEDKGWASISASGNYVVLMGKKLSDGTIHVSKVYNRDGSFVKELPGHFVHYDLTLDADGDDVGVGMKTGGANYNFSTIRLRDGLLRDLDPSLMMGTSLTHSSARNLGRPGWAYMTVNNGPDPFQKEIFALKLDGSGAVERLAHHRSNVTVYNTEPHAVPSPDGKRVLFASNWGPASIPIHTFVVDVRPICP